MIKDSLKMDIIRAQDRLSSLENDIEELKKLFERSFFSLCNRISGERYLLTRLLSRLEYEKDETDD